MLLPRGHAHCRRRTASSQREMRMNLHRITSSTVGLLVAALLLLVTGTYTDNGGFQLAGAMLLVVAVLIAFRQASSRDDSA